MATKTTKDLEKTKQALAQRPDFIKTGTDGTEDIGQDDLKLPQLKIAQGLSPQMLPDDSAHIEGLTLFEMFNDLSGEIYGKEDLTFVVCQRQVKRLEFDPDDRKIPIDLEVPLNDPRMKWTKDDDGKGVPPRATKFVEFVILIVQPGVGEPEPLVLSIQETNKYNKRAHERLSGFIKLRRPAAPIYAGLYTVRTGTEKNDKGTWGVSIINNAGFVQDEKLYLLAKGFKESLEVSGYTTDRERDAFDPSDMDRDQGPGDRDEDDM